MDDLILDPEKLDLFAVWIEQYCKKQEDIFREYIRKIESVGHDWNDDNTYGEMSAHIKSVFKNADQELEQIRHIYSRYYRNLAVEERSRPK